MPSSPDAPPEHLAIIVVNYGSHRLLEANLAPLARAVPEATVVVVDNYSSEGERDAVQKQAARHGWQLVPSAVNGGFGAGMNLGVRHALAQGASSILLLNPDAVLTATNLRLLQRRVSEDPSTLVAPVIRRSDGTVWFDGVDLHLDRGRMRASRHRSAADGARVEEWLTAACLMVSAEMWNRIGGFDEDYFLYWEDVDLSHRARLAGARLLVERAAEAVHDEGATHTATAPQSAGLPKSATYYYYNIRNRLLYAAKHLGPADRRRWARTAPSAALGVLLQGGRRQFLRPWTPLGAAVRGTWDGLAAMRRQRPSRSEHRTPPSEHSPA